MKKAHIESNIRKPFLSFRKNGLWRQKLLDQNARGETAWYLNIEIPVSGGLLAGTWYMFLFSIFFLAIILLLNASL